MNTATQVDTATLTQSLPFFEVDCDPVDQRYGSIKVYHDQKGPLGVLNYFYGSLHDVPDDHDRREAFYVTRFSIYPTLTKAASGITSHLSATRTLEKALLYIAACIADDQGEEVIYCRPGRAADQNALCLWEMLDIRELLGNFSSLVQAI